MLKVVDVMDFTSICELIFKILVVKDSFPNAKKLRTSVFNFKLWTLNFKQN
jgi:hypothetical protein